MEDESRNLEIKIVDSSPVVYRLETDPSLFDDILETLCEEILHNCTPSKVDDVFLEHITSIIEPIGWSAVWRSTKESTPLDFEYDFIVEVKNVSLYKLEADVIVTSIIVPDATDFDLDNYREKLKSDSYYSVPLLELYTISENDKEEMYTNTAMVIEYARLFYLYLRRPWDNEEDDFFYCQKVLKPRLQLYFDMKNNVLPKVMNAKIKAILEEGWKKSKELEHMFHEMNLSDSDNEINDDDLMQSMEIKAKLAELQSKLELFENPIIRTFIMKKYVPQKCAKEKTSPVTYVVAKIFTKEMISSLIVAPNTILEFEKNPEAAIKKSSSEDKVLIFPGVYECDTLGWLDTDIKIKGLGTNNDTILEATGNSDVFINCCAEAIYIENLTLKSKNGLANTIVIHHGKVEFKNCIIDSDGAKTGLLLLGGAQVSMEDSEVCNSKIDGIQLRPSSSLFLKSSKIVSCGGNGIQIEVPEDGITSDHVIELDISDSHLVNNEGHAIHVKNALINEISLKKPDGDLSILNRFTWLKHKIENTIMENNAFPAIGIETLYNAGKSTSSLPSKLSKYNCDDEENASVLNSLLNLSLRDLDITNNEIF